MDTPPSPDFGFDRPTPPTPPELLHTEKTSKVDEQKDESPYSPESPTWGPDDTPSPQEDIKIPVSLTPKSPSAHDSSKVEEAMKRYYKLKGAYDKKYNDAKKKLTAAGKGLSVDKIKKKLKNLRIGCINCKQSGGTLFTEDINGRSLLTAKCGHTEAPCALDIQIQQGKWMLLPTAAKMTQDSLDAIKADIIDLKLDLLFGLRTEEQITDQFTTDKTTYKEQTKQLNLLTGVIESENEIRVDGHAEDDIPRKIPIKQYLEIKNAQLQQLITTFKDLIADYMADIDDIEQSNQLLKQALNLYVEQIFPLMTKMRESTYAVTMMDHEEEQGLFIMKQVKTLLKNLDFEYEFGKIISDKK
jgi:hypothetical protein